MNEFALQLGAVICRAALAITSAKAGCYDSAVLGRIGWMAVAGLTLAAIAGWDSDSSGLSMFPVKLSPGE